MKKKYSFALLLMVPVLFFGNIVDSKVDEIKTGPLTEEASNASTAYFTVNLPDEPNCLGKETFSWKNNVQITNTGAVDADLRFVDSGSNPLFYQIPGPYPSEFSSGVTINIDEAISWDGYASRSLTNPQTAETWKVVFLKNGVVQFESSYTGDLQDGVNSAQWKGALNQNIQLPNGVDQILLVHYEDDNYGTGSVTSANSVVPSSVCFSFEPICDISADAGDDVEECTEENIELTATYTGSNECVTGCVYPVLDVLKCSSNPDSEEVWLSHSGQPSNEYKFNATNQNFQTFDNGTARYTATASNGVDVVQVDMLYSGYTTTPPVNSPKEHACGYSQETGDFVYYTQLDGTITSQNHGTFSATTAGPSFQVGVGADVTRNGFGASGWFTLSGGDGYYTNGDINLPLGDCIEQGTEEVSFLWSTTDGTIVSASDQETIEVSESGTYTVTVTNCQGCTATDEVIVNILEKLTIGDFVWEDLNRNGLQDTNEPGVDGLSVTLYDANGTVVADTNTANGGSYSFEVCPGEYYIVFGNVPVDFAFTNADAGDDTLDSDANANGRTPNFVITDSDNTTIDAGLVKLCTIDPTVDGDKEICLDEEAMLMATGGDTYLWNTGENTASIKVSPKETTTYTVVVSNSTIAGCSEELSFTVEVQSVNIDAGPDVSINLGDDTTLTVSGAGASDDILWSTGETTTSIIVAPESMTTYSVTVVNALGCMGEDYVIVDVANACGIEPAFKILPRDQPGVYAAGYETAACIGDDLYLWMYADINNLNDALAEDFTEWSFTFEFPNGDVIVQSNRPNWPGNHRTEKLNLTLEDFGEYKITWISPTGCTGSTVFTLNFPDEGCGDNGTRISDIFSIDAVYPIPAAGGSELTLEINTESRSLSSLADKGALAGKIPELVSRKETIHVSLYNFDGRKIGQTRTFDVEQGKVKVYYQLSNLATGNYIIKVDGDEWSDSKQIIVE